MCYLDQLILRRKHTEKDDNDDDYDDDPDSVETSG